MPVLCVVFPHHIPCAHCVCLLVFQVYCLYFLLFTPGSLPATPSPTSPSLWLTLPTPISSLWRFGSDRVLDSHMADPSSIPDHNYTLSHCFPTHPSFLHPSINPVNLQSLCLSSAFGSPHHHVHPNKSMLSHFASSAVKYLLLRACPYLTISTECCKGIYAFGSLYTEEITQQFSKYDSVEHIFFSFLFIFL